MEPITTPTCNCDHLYKCTPKCEHLVSLIRLPIQELNQNFTNPCVNFLINKHPETLRKSHAIEKNIGKHFQNFHPLILNSKII